MCRDMTRKMHAGSRGLLLMHKEAAGRVHTCLVCQAWARVLCDLFVCCDPVCTGSVCATL